MHSAEEAADATRLRQWQEQYPGGGLIALVAEASIPLAKTLGELASQLSLPLVGAVFPRLIVQDRFVDCGMLLLWFADMPKFQIQTDLLPLPGKAPDLHKLADFLAENASPTGQDLTFLCFDGMLPNIGSLLDRLYLDLGDTVTYLGCNAGSERFQPMPCLFVGSQWYEQAVLAFLLPGPVATGLTHNYKTSTATVVATSGSGNLINQIDHLPALSRYEQLVEDGYKQRLTADNFYEMAVHFPVAILRADGEPLVRIPVALNESGAMYCVGEVPANALLTVVTGPQPGDRQSADYLVQALGKTPAKATLVFACAGRCLHLGETAASAELADLRQRLPAPAMLGAVTLGEIGCTPSGYPLFHNGALLGVNLQLEPS